MDKISVTFRFVLEDGKEDKIVINNVSEEATDEQIATLANEIIAGNTELNGQKLTSLKSCTKTVTTEREISF